MNDSKAWPELEQVIAALERYRDDVTLEIRVVERCRNQSSDEEVQLVIQYIVCDSVTETVAFAKAKGWRVATRTPKGRQYSTADIWDLITNPPGEWTTALINLARRSYWTERRKLDHGKIM